MKAKKKQGGDMYRKIKAFIEKLIHDNIFDLSAQIAYYMLMSFFPFLILIVSIVGIVFSNNVDILQFIVDFLPSTIRPLILDNAKYIYEAKSPAVLSVSFIATAWLALRGVRTLMTAMNRVYGIEDHRGIIKFNLFSFLNLIITTVAISSVLVITIWLGLDIAFTTKSSIFLLIRGFSVFFILFVAFLFINSFMPAKRIHIKYTAIGSLFSSVALIICSFGFGYYASNIWQYSRIYGTLGTVVVFLVWLFMDGMILLLGSEINAFLYDRKQNEILSIPPAEPKKN